MAQTSVEPIVDMPEDGATPPKTLTPYASFKTFKSLIDRLDKDGVPGRFDASYFTQYSGAVKSQIKITLRALELMDDDDCATDSLSQLIATQGEDRQQLMRQIFTRHYRDALSLPDNATSLQLSEVFKNRGLTGDTVNKATSFFLAMADYAGQPVSPFFKQVRTRNASKPGGARRPRPSRSTATSVPDSDKSDTAKGVNSRPHADSEQDPKTRYVNFLMDLLEKQDAEPSSEILDRIERVLGLGGVEDPA